MCGLKRERQVFDHIDPSAIGPPAGECKNVGLAFIGDLHLEFRSRGAVEISRHSAPVLAFDGCGIGLSIRQCTFCIGDRIWTARALAAGSVEAVRAYRPTRYRGSCCIATDKGGRRRAALVGKHYDFRSDLHAVVEIGHVGVRHANAAARDVVTNRRRLVGAVNAVERAGEIKRVRPKRVPGAPGNEAGQIRLPADHLRRWKPIRPLGLAFDRVHAGPGEPFPHYADSVTQCLATTENQIEVSFSVSITIVPGTSLVGFSITWRRRCGGTSALPMPSARRDPGGP